MKFRNLALAMFYTLGSVEERQFCDGQKNGPAIIRFLNGDTFEFNYTNSEMEG